MTMLNESQKYALDEAIETSIETIRESRFDAGTKHLYLTRTITSPWMPFYESLDKLHDPSSPESIELIRALKTIHDLYSNSEVIFGIHGARNALVHYLKNLGSYDDTTVNAAKTYVRELVKTENCLLMQNSEDKITGEEKARQAAEKKLDRQPSWRTQLNLLKKNGDHQLQPPQCLPEFQAVIDLFGGNTAMAYYTALGPRGQIALVKNSENVKTLMRLNGVVLWKEVILQNFRGDFLGRRIKSILPDTIFSLLVNHFDAFMALLRSRRLSVSSILLLPPKKLELLLTHPKIFLDFSKASHSNLGKLLSLKSDTLSQLLLAYQSHG